MKKIVHVCLCGSFGEMYAYQDNLLPKYHRRLGFEVTIIAPTYSTINPSDGSLNEEPADTKTLCDGSVLKRLLPALPKVINRRLHIFWGLYRTLVNEGPNLIFVHGLDSLSYMAIGRYWRHHKDVKIVIDNHSDWNNSYHSILSWRWLKCINNPLVTKPSLKYCSQYYGVTPARCDFLHEAFGIPRERIKLLPMGADDDFLRNDLKERQRHKIRQIHHVGEDDFLIVTGGKIDRKKNIHVLAQAVTELNNAKIKLLVFGGISDDLKKVFSAFPAESVICIGWIPSQDVYNYFHAADLVFFPGLHSVLWEQAVASKVPCVFTKIVGFEHVDFGGNAILLNDISVESCKKVINELYDNSERYMAMKSFAESDGSNSFVYSKIAEQVIKDVEISSC